ncbi:MAG: DNA polymerase III subunit gamma/tau [Pyrinomonadaceae bacterium]
MSYQVIARKWRPQTFEEVTGQEIITQTLRNALEFDRLHHAYLFSGSRGVGKTTTARILAKALNCHKTSGKPNLTPCLLTDADICASCIEISEGRSIDVLEIDAASHTGIDDVRETILESINFNPARDRYKVFIIDEVHQLSKPAFNALLKTLEEPPENVVFIMATTELHKVPETILSRCQEFEFRTIPLPKIFDRLKLIADAEKINITDDALRELARSGEGSMRDAQSNFDQVISFSGEEITSENVTKALGFAGVETLSLVIKAIAEKDAKGTLDVVDDLIGRGHDLRNFCRDLLGLFRDLLVFKVAGSESKLYESALLSPDEMKAASEPFTEADLLRFFNSLAETETKLKEASHSRHILEIGLIRLIEMRRVVAIEDILTRLSALESGTPLAEKKTLIPDSPKTALSVPVAVVASEATKPEPVAADPPPVVQETVPPFPNIEPSAAAAHPSVEITIPSAIFHSEPPEEASDRDFSLDEPPEDMSFYDAPIDLPDEPPVIVPKHRERVNTAVSMPTARLSLLTSEELEHFDDPRLDSGYEDKLTLTGDDLMPLATTKQLVIDLFGVEETLPVRIASANRTAAATAPRRDMSHLIPDLGRSDKPVEMPVLSADPDPAELLKFAESHPTVRTAMRVFRATVIEAKRT